MSQCSPRRSRRYRIPAPTLLLVTMLLGALPGTAGPIAPRSPELGIGASGPGAAPVEGARGATGGADGAWTELVVGARDSHSAIYDPVRHRMLVFGGFDGAERNDVWALTLSGSPAWAALSPTGAPPAARMGHSAIYDPVRDRMIVFGGNDGANRNDVWALSLSGAPAWTALSPAGTPPTARHDHSAIYDPVRDRMLVFGGTDGTARNDVWALSLAGAPTWTLVSPGGMPPAARSDHSAIYDPVRDRMLVFGGIDGALRNDAWALALAGAPAWSALAPTGTLPSGRREQTAIYDATRDRMVAFAGAGPVTYSQAGDTWDLSLSGAPAWIPTTSLIQRPLPRYGHSAIYDSARSRMIVFGGTDGSQLFNDAWSLSLTGSMAWTPLGPMPATPTARYGHSAVYDPVRDRMLVFGGFDGADRNDVWALALSGSPSWTLLSPDGTPPVGRAFSSAIYDPVRDQMIVFAGNVGGGSPDNGAPSPDLWMLSLAGTPVWTQSSAPEVNPAMFGHAAVYDSQHDRMVVCGGHQFCPGCYDERTWTLSLSGAPAWTGWYLVPTDLGIREYASAIYDPQRDRVLLFGGDDRFTIGLHDDVGALSFPAFATWTALGPLGAAPPVRDQHTAVYDPALDRMIVFGGAGAGFSRNDVWAYWPGGVANVGVLPAASTLSWLRAPAPNPTRGGTTLSDSIAVSGRVQLAI